MADIPPEYVAILEQLEAYRLANGGQLPPSGVLKQIYKQLLQKMTENGGEANPEVLFYTAQNLMKVYGRAMALLKVYPPTHRKGVGKDGGKLRIPQDPWWWYFDGTQSGGVGGGEGDGGDSGDTFTGVLDWAPQSEIDRARAMLRQVADEFGFGPGDDPLPMLDEVAKRLGGRWGLNGKRGDPNNPSHDVLAWDIPGYAPQLFDVITDWGGSNGLSWSPIPYGGAAVWIAP